MNCFTTRIRSHELRIKSRGTSHHAKTAFKKRLGYPKFIYCGQGILKGNNRKVAYIRVFVPDLPCRPRVLPFHCQDQLLLESRGFSSVRFVDKFVVVFSVPYQNRKVLNSYLKYDFVVRVSVWLTGCLFVKILFLRNGLKLTPT